MARPPLPPGELSPKLSVTEYADNPAASRWRARGRMRLVDHSRRDASTGAYAPGRRVDVDGWGPTRAKAEAACRKAAQARMVSEATRAATTRKAQTEARKLGQVAATLLDSAESSKELAASSLASYRQAMKSLERHTNLMSMDLADVRPTDVATALALITAAAGERTRAAQGGTGAAKTCRSLLNRVFNHAVRIGWLDSSPVRDAGAIRRPRRDAPEATTTHLDHTRALTKAERSELAWSMACSERAVRLDVRDLVLAGMAIGGRVGEVCAVRWCDLTIVRKRDPQTGRLDLTGTVHLGATVDREAGRGIVRHAPKTATSVRTIPLPRRTVALLLRRARAAGVDLDAMHLDTRPVFPAPGRWGQSTAWRDRSNSAALLRQEFDAAGFPWLSFHGLRRAAVTALLDHLPVRLVADYAGHSSVRTTLDAYIGRSAVSLDVVKHL